MWNLEKWKNDFITKQKLRYRHREYKHMDAKEGRMGRLELTYIHCITYLFVFIII